MSSTLDEALMKHLDEASAVAGITKPKAKAKEKKVFEYPEGTMPFLSLFAVGRTDLNIPVKVFKDEDWPESLRQFIPDRDEQYVFDPEATLTVVAALFDPETAVTGSDKVLLHGPKGSGKTTLPQQICARVRMPYIRVNCRGDMESSALFGSVKYSPTEGMVWVDGPIPELARHGGLVCIDEVSRTPAEINAALMAILERDGAVYLADKPGDSADKFIKPHPWFRIVCTDNTELQGDTTGKYVGTNVQDEALIDRFNTTYRLGYLSPAHEVAIITGKFKDVDNLSAQRMVQMASKIREAYDSGNIGFTMSPRGLLEWARKISYWQDNRKAFKLSFFNKLTQTDAQVVAEFYHTIFAENLTK
jgi:cobaltochelatase CobS